MRQLTEFARTLELTLLVVVLLSSSAIVIGQQQPPAVPHPSASSVQVTPRQGPFRRFERVTQYEPAHAYCRARRTYHPR
jgi:hypothetical protein